MRPVRWVVLSVVLEMDTDAWVHPWLKHRVCVCGLLFAGEEIFSVGSGLTPSQMRVYNNNAFHYQQIFLLLASVTCARVLGRHFQVSL